MMFSQVFVPMTKEAIALSDAAKLISHDAGAHIRNTASSAWDLLKRPVHHTWEGFKAIGPDKDSSWYGKILRRGFQGLSLFGAGSNLMDSNQGYLERAGGLAGHALGTGMFSPTLKKPFGHVTGFLGNEVVSGGLLVNPENAPGRWLGRKLDSVLGTGPKHQNAQAPSQQSAQQPVQQPTQKRWHDVPARAVVPAMYGTAYGVSGGGDASIVR